MQIVKHVAPVRVHCYHKWLHNLAQVCTGPINRSSFDVVLMTQYQKMAIQRLRSAMMTRLVAVFFLLAIAPCWTYPNFQQNIPNGNKVACAEQLLVFCDGLAFGPFEGTGPVCPNLLYVVSPAGA